MLFKKALRRFGAYLKKFQNPSRMNYNEMEEKLLQILEIAYLMFWLYASIDYPRTDDGMQSGCGKQRNVNIFQLFFVVVTRKK